MFVGSVFSPYYAFSGRKDPDNHLCFNVALYSPSGNRWAMTERGAADAERAAERYALGPSSIAFDGREIVIEFDEVSVPRPPAQWLPRRIAGRIRLTPSAITAHSFAIDGAGKHIWWPVGPSGRIEVERTDGSGESWSGHGYTDSNWGSEPLEAGFRRWDWARGDRPQASGGGAYIIYDTERRDGSADCLALAIAEDGTISHIDPPSSTRLPRAFWGVERRGHHDAARLPVLARTLEDGPFYTRSIIDTEINGDPVRLMHEGLSGDRFASPIVKLMLPWRMPRWASKQKG